MIKTEHLIKDITLTPQEWGYVKSNFKYILTSTEKEFVKYKKGLDADTLKDMQYVLDNDTNKIDSKGQDAIYYGLHMNVWVESGIVTANELEYEVADDELYCSLFDKIMKAC